MTKKNKKIVKEIPQDIKITFNEFCIRELKLDISDDDKLSKIEEIDNTITLIK